MGGGADHSWLEFLQSYQSGTYDASSIPPQPRQSQRSDKDATKLDPNSKEPVYPRVSISQEDADRAEAYFHQNRHLPPPISRYEDTRLRINREYDINGPAQRKAIDRCARLAHRFFGKDTVVTISFFENRHQTVFAVEGNLGIPAGTLVVQEIGICSHAILRSEPLVVEDLALDWRFRNNPHSQEGKLIRSYHGYPINLPIDPLKDADPGAAELETVPCGVIAIMSLSKPLPHFTEAGRLVLDDLCGILCDEIRCLRRERQRQSETELRGAISLFLEEALIGSVRKSPTSHEQSNTYGMLAEEDLYKSAAQRLCVHTQSDAVLLFDISALHRSTVDTFAVALFNDATLESARTGVRILVQHQADESQPSDQLDHAHAADYVMQFLKRYTTDQTTIFDQNECSGLEGLLSEKFSSHIAAPVFILGQPHLLLVAASTDRPVPYSADHRDFVLSIGAIIQARLLCDRLAEADKAKISFISQITHELRTPLHGITSELECLKDALDSGNTSSMGSMLAIAESCGQTLSDILNDVLDFGKLSFSSVEKTADYRKRQHSTRNLLQLMRTTCKTCLDRIAKDRGTEGSDDDRVDFYLDCEERDQIEWLADIDAVGFQRILFNLLTNALKYTQEGSIVLTVKLLPADETNETDRIMFQCADTGRGMSPAFLLQLFQPFSQADSFSQGAGLGLFITQAVIKRMDGVIDVESELSKGTTFTVTLPYNRPEERSEALQSDVTTSRALILPDSRLRAGSSAASTPAQIHDSDTLVLPDSPVVALNMSSPNTNMAARSLSTTSPSNELHPDLRLLLADDNRISRTIMVQIARKHGVNYVQAADGVEAVAEFAHFRPHVVWTDVNMPKMDGIRAAKEMRLIEQKNQYVPAFSTSISYRSIHADEGVVVALTGLGQSDDLFRQEALLGRAALDKWLIKGQSKPNDLLKTLQTASQKLYDREATPTNGDMATSA